MPAPTKKPVRVARAFVDPLHVEPTVALVATIVDPSTVSLSVEVEGETAREVSALSFETILSLLRSRA